jgi:hypothetical protein
MDDEIFDVFTGAVSKDDLREAAGRLVFNTGNPLDVHRANGGPAGSVIKERLLKGTRKVEDLPGLTNRLLDHYGLRDFYPEVPLVREALALTVQLKRIVEKIHPNFYGVLSELVEQSDPFGTPDEVYLLSYEQVGEIARKVIEE